MAFRRPAMYVPGATHAGTASPTLLTRGGIIRSPGLRWSIRIGWSATRRPWDRVVSLHESLRHGRAPRSRRDFSLPFGMAPAPSGGSEVPRSCAVFQTPGSTLPPTTIGVPRCADRHDLGSFRQRARRAHGLRGERPGRRTARVPRAVGYPRQDRRIDCARAPHCEYDDRRSLTSGSKACASKLAAADPFDGTPNEEAFGEANKSYPDDAVIVSARLPAS